jgi:hypothetical protein
MPAALVAIWVPNFAHFGPLMKAPGRLSRVLLFWSHLDRQLAPKWPPGGGRNITTICGATDIYILVYICVILGTVDIIFAA